MKFIEGFLVGGMVGTGFAFMYSDRHMMWNPKKILKKGKQIAKKIGMY